MGYWTNVSGRASVLAAKSVGLESRERVIVAFLINCAISFGLWEMLPKVPDSAIWTRILTALVPFLIWPIIFIWKLIDVPATIDKEKQDEIDELKLKLVSNLFISTNPYPVPTSTHDSRGATIYGFVIGVTNLSTNKTVEDCTVTVSASKIGNIYNPTGAIQVEKPFDLHAKEIKHVLIIRTENAEDGIRRYAIIPPDQEADPQLIIADYRDMRDQSEDAFVQPYILDISVFAKDHPPASLTTGLMYDVHRRAWTIQPLERATV